MLNTISKYPLLPCTFSNTSRNRTKKHYFEKRIACRFPPQPLNYEKRKVHTLHIEGVNTHLDPRFSHLGAFKDTTTLRIIIGDVDEPPVFSIDYYIMDVYENSPVGTEVGTVTAQDPDSTKSPIR